MVSEALKKKIARHRIISFDIYDTLIKRNVERPEDIFTLVENEYNLRFASSPRITNFSINRADAYRKAYEQLKAKCGIEDIYDALSEYSLEEKERLKCLEIEIEKNICIPNYNIIDVYNYAIETNKTVAIVSDMYLPYETISEILSRCGIKRFDYLFISCEFGVSKTDGGLFDICCEHYGIVTKDLLHFGDGLKNDVVRAFLKGVNVVWVRSENKLSYDDNHGFNDLEKLQYSLQQSFIKNNSVKMIEPNEKLGFEVFGPLVYGFCRWLHESIKKNSIDRVYFLAREGMIFKTIYEMLYPEDSLELRYLFVSRKSLVAPTYWIDSRYESVIKSIAKSKDLDIITIVKRWGLDPEECKEAFERLNINPTMLIDGRTLQDNRQVRELYEILKSRIVQISRYKYSILEKYLEQEAFGGRNAIVDIGWNGGMQNAFSKIATVWKEPTEIFGYYIGINTTNLGVDLENTNGFVYEGDRAEENRYYIYSFAGPLELSLTAAHDTTIEYAYNGDKVVPVFGCGEYINPDGTYKDELQYTIAVQSGMKKYVELFLSQGMDKYTKVYSEVSFRNCRLFGLTPKLKHIKIFSSFGANDLGTQQHFVNPKYMHLFGNNNVLNGFWTSTWKSGFMKKVFKLPLPYYKLYTYMRKRVN